MAKHKRKIQAGLAARVAGYVPVAANGQKCHKPGSQNIKRSGTGHRSGR